MLFRRRRDDGSINQTQRLNLELIKRASFNNFDGDLVVGDLLAHRHLWRAVMMTRPSGVMLALRDLDEDFWSVDTLVILANGNDDPALYALANTWHADEVRWMSEEERDDALGGGLIGEDLDVLSVWWD